MLFLHILLFLFLFDHLFGLCQNNLVYQQPGFFFPKRKRLSKEHLGVTDEPELHDSNSFSPRIVFPVALFPEPVFPRITILISSVLVLPSAKN